MKYQKPEVRVVSMATKAIEGQGCKDPSPLDDSIDHTPFNTVATYRADE